ncbi:MAG: hypothetical protein N0C91_15900 [Candidatus Thiodiazotropha endolucinida]|nr:hypothetical protein [Candidatus Thiodiazotropha taylori]MCG8122057.1 hypothetical protein [Candidatus Thiodiazotropha taylori]MCW4289187.1 hypothetical protein [Candidatus Thiodiazotropha endolucinida]MCW4297752.1 hypothetical protein [Candidatus Thiodiazotropha endolucinida]
MDIQAFKSLKILLGVSNMNVNNSSIYAFIFLFAACQNAYSIDDENAAFRNKIISDLKKEAVNFYCDNNWIILQMGTKDQQCEAMVNKFADDCGVLISPLIPLLPKGDEYKDNEFKTIKEQWDNVGRLYSVCIQGQAFSYTLEE